MSKHHAPRLQVPAPVVEMKADIVNAMYETAPQIMHGVMRRTEIFASATLCAYANLRSETEPTDTAMTTMSWLKTALAVAYEVSEQVIQETVDKTIHLDQPQFEIEFHKALTMKKLSPKAKELYTAVFGE